MLKNLTLAFLMFLGIFATAPARAAELFPGVPDFVSEGTFFNHIVCDNKSAALRAYEFGAGGGMTITTQRGVVTYYIYVRRAGDEATLFVVKEDEEHQFISEDNFRERLEQEAPNLNTFTSHAKPGDCTVRWIN